MINLRMRQVPDVGLNADPNTGMLVGQVAQLFEVVGEEFKDPNRPAQDGSVG